MKCTKAEKTKRIYQVQQLIIDGYGNYEIIQYIADNWNLTERQARNYIKLANELIQEIYDKEIKSKLAWKFVARRRMYRKAMQSEQYALALQILKDISELEGDYKHVGTPENPLQINLVGTGKDFGMEEGEGAV